MVISIICIFLALVLYSVAVWIERLKKKFVLWIIITFASGFTCDLLGTSIMFMRAINKFTIHTIFGYIALLIMLLHLVWAILAKNNTKYEIYFTKFSIFAWCVWLLAFLSGIPH